jgi:hypothetical protein
MIPSSDARTKTMLLFAGGIVATLGVVAGIVLLWPNGDDDAVTADRPSSTLAELPSTSADGALGEPSAGPTTTDEPAAPARLFETGARQALAEVADAAGDPGEAIEVSVYPEYLFLAYRDPSEPGNIDRRAWRDGKVSDADPNPIDDRVDETTTPKLFPLSAIDLDVLPRLIDDAPGRFDLDVGATHVIINRFLPFDQRVLIRVYASPTDGRSGGGYVQYTLDGTFVKVVQ